MKHILCLLGLALVFVNHTHAQDNVQIDYNLQGSEQVTLQDTREVTLYRTEYVNSTCSRQEPYTDTECGNETRYRNECTWVPGRNVCRTENDYQCRNVRRTRRECTAGRTRRECVNEPARRVCRTRNGVERCTNVPGRQRCRDVSGPQTCRNVPYTERECNNVPRRVCDYIPGGNECRNVPYQEYVCRDVTRYRTVDYACKKPVQVPYQVEKSFTYEVNFNFKDVDQLGRATIKAVIDKEGLLKLHYTNLNTSETYINLLSDNQEALINSDSEYKGLRNIEINFGNLEKLTAPMKTNMKSLWMNKSGDFKLTLTQPDLLENAKIKVRVFKRSNNNLHFSKELELSDFRVSNKDIKADFSTFGFDTLKGLFGKGVKLKVEVSVMAEEPENLLVPIENELKKSKSFNIKVYKNK